MPQSAAIEAAKNERARKDQLMKVLKKDGAEGVYRELYRATMEGLIELNYAFEEELLIRVSARIPEERRGEIEAEVDAEVDAELAEDGRLQDTPFQRLMSAADRRRREREEAEHMALAEERRSELIERVLDERVLDEEGPS